MLKQTTVKNQLPSEISATFAELRITDFLRKAGITKSKGFPARRVFIFLFSLIFKGRSLNQVLTGREADEYFKKDTVYRFMNHEKNNWRKFLLSLSTFVISKLHVLTDAKTHARVLILDDSSYYRNRSKKVNLAARLYDHAKHCSYKGFRMLTLGFSDGYSFMPIDFALLSGKHKISTETTPIDQRTSGGKRYAEAFKEAPTVSLKMVKQALDNGIYATHILMDKWFTYPKALKEMSDIGIHVIGMAKNSNTKYFYQNRLYTLSQLFSKAYRESTSDAIISSLQIRLQSGIPVKVVFVQNKNQKSEWLALMTTDVGLSSKEIVTYYTIRWSIETFFKAVKSLLNLEKETQTRNYNAMICHTTVVFTRYIILSWQQRCAIDDRTLGGMFYELCEELQELDWSVALVELTKILLDVMDQVTKRVEKFLKCQLQQWFDDLPSYIKAYLPILNCES